MLELERDGALLCAGAAGLQLLELARVFSELEPGRPGARLRSSTPLNAVVGVGSVAWSRVARILGNEARPVRALAFDKTPENNWPLTWHQDRTIVVRERVDAPGFGPWTIKDGLVHVAPPIEVLERMLTVRIHLDAIDENNAPLLIALGSHRLGRVPDADVKNVVARSEVFTCLAAPGDIWLYSTPILHASEPARPPTHRRVLQVDYANFDLPNRLEWFELG